MQGPPLRTGITLSLTLAALAELSCCLATQALQKYGVDLTAKVAVLDPVIGRDEEIRRCIRVLCRRTKNNPVLIGDPGVGKTAIVEGLAQRVVSFPDAVPSCLQLRTPEQNHPFAFPHRHNG